MNKFTAGPWKVVADERYDRFAEADRIVGYDIKSADGEIVGSEGISGDSEINLANAHLIAAAPDLLEALEALADSAPSACCVDFHHKPGDYHDADESCPALDRYEAACLSARAAIARARGAE